MIPKAEVATSGSEASKRLQLRRRVPRAASAGVIIAMIFISTSDLLSSESFAGMSGISLLSDKAQRAPRASHEYRLLRDKAVSWEVDDTCMQQLYGTSHMDACEDCTHPSSTKGMIPEWL